MNYSEFVRSRFKSGELIAAEMNARKLTFLDVSTKTLVRDAESLDNVKKFAYYNKHVKYLCEGEMPQSRFDDFKPTPSQCELLHAAVGLAGEAGELLDAVRKHVFDGHDLDVGNCIEEMGDLGFFFQAMLHALGVDRAYIEAMNQSKLLKRYEGGYSDQQAQERKDKQ